jgi:TetR/AcrR family transcriptional regulator, cholesterol catabolism regulator
MKSTLEEKILDTATDLFAKHGFVKASVRDIAKLVKGSNSCLYVYFKNKDEILFRIITDVGADLLKKLEAVVSRQDDPVECLREMITAQIQFSLNAAKRVKISLEELYQLPPPLKKKAFSQHRRIYDLYYNRIRVLEERGLLCRDIDKTLIAFGIFSNMNWVYRWYKPTGKLSVEKITEHITTMLFRSILKNPPAEAKC